MSTGEPKRFAPAQDLVPVQAVLPERNEGEGALVILRDGSFRIMMRTGTVNFEMKSPPEREGITYAFGEMLDGLTPESPIEIVSHAKQLDTEAYVRQYEAVLANERTPPAIRGLIKAHIEHYETQVKAQNLLMRELYIVVPWKRIGGPVTESVTDQFPFSGLIRQIGRVVESKVAAKVNVADRDIAQARQNLALRCDDIAGRLMQMGIWSQRLDEIQVRKLLYELYHPGLSQIQRNVDLDVDDRLIPGFSADQRPTRQAAPRALEPPSF